MCGGCLKDTLSNLKKRHSRTIVTGQDPGNEIYMVSGNPKYLRNILAKHYLQEYVCHCGTGGCLNRPAVCKICLRYSHSYCLDSKDEK
jgi:hypothetical protein